MTDPASPFCHTAHADPIPGRNIVAHFTDPAREVPYTVSHTLYRLSPHGDEEVVSLIRLGVSRRYRVDPSPKEAESLRVLAIEQNRKALWGHFYGAAAKAIEDEAHQLKMLMLFEMNDPHSFRAHRILENIQRLAIPQIPTGAPEAIRTPTP